MKVFVYRDDDGKAVIVYPMANMYNPNSKERQALTERGVTFETEDELNDYIAKQAIPSGKRYKTFNQEDLPADRYFRDAWVADIENNLEVDMNKAKDIHMSAIRKWRDEQLASLDGPSLRAIETQDADAIAEIFAEKQALRDIPQTIDLDVANTPEELKNIKPEGMKE